MKKGIYKTSFIEYLETILNKYQRAGSENVQERYKSLIDKTGVIISEIDSEGNLSNELRVDKVNNTKIWINPGKAIDINFEVVTVDVGFEHDVLEAGTSMYAIVRYDTIKSEPVEKTLPYFDGDLHTYSDDHYKFYLKYPEELLLGSDEIILAKLIFDGNGLKEVVDERHDRVLKIKSSLLSADILFRQPAPPPPRRLRATSGLEEDFSRTKPKFPVLHSAWIELKWNDFGGGNGGLQPGYFIANTSDVWTMTGVDEYIEDEWVGFWLQHIGSGKRYKILGNSGWHNAEFSLDTPDNLTGGSFRIYCEGQGYNVLIKSYFPLNGEPSETDWFLMGESTITNKLQQSCTFRGLLAGQKIRGEIASIGSWYQEDFSNYITEVFTIVEYAELETVDVLQSVTVIPRNTGFTVRVTVKDLYKEKIMAAEIAWTDDGTDPDFNTSKCYIIPTGKENDGWAEPGFLGAIGPNPDKNYKVVVRCIDTLSRRTLDPYVSAESAPDSPIINSMEELQDARDGELTLLTKVQKFNADVLRYNKIVDAEGNLTIKAILQAQAITNAVTKSGYVDDNEHTTAETTDWEDVGNMVKRTRPSFLTSLRIQVHLMTSREGIPVYAKVFVKHGGLTVDSGDQLTSSSADTNQDPKDAIIDVACIGGGTVEIYVKAKGSTSGPDTSAAIIDYLECNFCNY